MKRFDLEFDRRFEKVPACCSKTPQELQNYMLCQPPFKEIVLRSSNEFLDPVTALHSSLIFKLTRKAFELSDDLMKPLQRSSMQKERPESKAEASGTSDWSSKIDRELGAQEQTFANQQQETKSISSTENRNVPLSISEHRLLKVFRTHHAFRIHLILNMKQRRPPGIFTGQQQIFVKSVWEVSAEKVKTRKINHQNVSQSWSDSHESLQAVPKKVELLPVNLQNQKNSKFQSNNSQFQILANWFCC
jgi:hypothetical protein